LRLFGRLDILSNSLALPALRAPCIYARLRALDTKRYEISGLDILSYMPSSPSLRAPCIHARLCALVTKPYEISGLTLLRIGGEKAENIHYFTLHSKLAASSVLPEPLYTATCGQGQSGRVVWGLG